MNSRGRRYRVRQAALIRRRTDATRRAAPRHAASRRSHQNCPKLMPGVAPRRVTRGSENTRANVGAQPSCTRGECALSAVCRPYFSRSRFPPSSRERHRPPFFPSSLPPSLPPLAHNVRVTCTVRRRGRGPARRYVQIDTNVSSGSSLSDSPSSCIPSLSPSPPLSRSALVLISLFGKGAELQHAKWTRVCSGI